MVGGALQPHLTPQSVAALDPLGGMAHMLHHMRPTHSSHGAPTC